MVEKKKEIKVKKYDIVRVDLGDAVIGSEQGGIRPAVVIQNDKGNYYSPTTIIMPLTSQKRNLNQPTHILLEKNDVLSEDSIVLGEQIRVVDKTRILQYMGKVEDKNVQKKIDIVFRSIAEC